MVQVIQEPVSPLESLLGGLGLGFASGVENQLKFKQQQDLQAQKDQQKQEQNQRLFEMLGISAPQTSQPEIGQQQQQQQQQNIQPNMVGKSFDASNLTDEQILAASQLDPNLGKILQGLKSEGEAKVEAQRKEVRESFKDTKEYRSKTAKNFGEQNLIKARLDRMDKLIDQGKLSGPIKASVAKKLDLPIGLFSGSDSEEFDKLSKDLLKNISTYFPGKINIVEVENFMKTIPSLMLTDEGKKRVIRNVRLLLSPQELEYKAMRKLEREAEESGKPLPLDLEGRIQDMIQPELDSILEQLVLGEEPKEAKETPQAQQQFEQLPNPAQYKGRIITDTETGKRFKSTGTGWKEVK